MRPEETRRDQKRRELTRRAGLLALLLLTLLRATVLPAQNPPVQRIWLSFAGTADLGAMVVGPGVAEVATASTGATTAGGSLSWVEHRERTDHLGMRHVYYRQQYLDPRLGFRVRVLGSALALHHAPDGSLRWAQGAQLPDVVSVAAPAVTDSEQAFAAAHAAAVGYPGFAPGDPGQWGAATVASLVAASELMLAPADGGGGLRYVWRVPSRDVRGTPWSLLLDAAAGQLLAARPTNPAETYVDCSPGSPDSVDARAKPQSETVQAYYPPDGFRPTGEVKANPCSSGNESCGPNLTCTHEAVWEAKLREAQPHDTIVPQVEVYHGQGWSENGTRCYDPTEQGGTIGDYMRTGLKVAGGAPTYDAYGGKQGTAPHYRRVAGDAMLFTRRTMEVLNDTFSYCGYDGGCGDAARVVVDAQCWSELGNAWFMFDDGYSSLAPTDAVGFCKSNLGHRSMAAAQDIVAHEWGHAVSKHSPANFKQQCIDFPWEVEPCEINEGFADVVGHVVERLTQDPDPTPHDDSFQAERWEWTAGEDWDTNVSLLRRADVYADDHRYSLHADDPSSGDTVHGNGNRLATVLYLLSEGGTNPVCDHGSFGGCDISVVPVDSFAIAANILFRVLTVQADESTDRWAFLPYVAVEATYDLLVDDDPADPCAYAAQDSVRQAFAAVGYPGPYAEVPLVCGEENPPRPCPPVCDE